MARPKSTEIEYRNYLLPAYFPILLLKGDEWRISSKPSEVLHFHNCVEIGICHENSGTLIMSNQKTTFKEGDITFISRDMPHTTYSDDPNNLSLWSYIFVDVQNLIGDYFPMDLLSGGNELNTLLTVGGHIFSRNENPELYTLVMLLIEELQSKNRNFQFTVRSIVFTIVMRILNKVDSEKSSDIGHHDNSLSIAPALEHIRKNYSQDFPIEDLAMICDMSPTHFRRTFHSVMNLTPLEYLNNTRINASTRLLRTTEKSILDISEECGFQSVSTFNRHFSDIMGITPTQYRNKMSSVNDRSILKCTGWMIPPKTE